MKRSILYLLMLFFGLNLNAQFGTAHNFTVVDINGNEHNLYELLESGKIVVLDVSATWCGPCWQVHQNHYLEDLNKMFGPEGTDQIVVIFYEGDASTGEDALNGTGGATLGDWVTGVSYPIINESPLQLDLNLYAPYGFPTINLIRPSDKEIIEDMWNYNLDGMVTSVENLIAAEGLSSTREEIELSKSVVLSPNPAQNVIQLSTDIDFKSAQVVNVLGETVLELNGKKTIDISTLIPGQYIVRLVTNENLILNKAFQKI